MNGQTLQALRCLLFFSVPEAANMIAQVQERTWRYWESGRNAIPADVSSRILELVAFREKLITELQSALNEVQAEYGHTDDVYMTYYSTLDDWMTQECAEPILWRPHCSAMAEAAAQGAVMVRFDAVEYAKWLGKRQDNSALRGQWVAKMNEPDDY